MQTDSHDEAIRRFFAILGKASEKLRRLWPFVTFSLLAKKIHTKCTLTLTSNIRLPIPKTFHMPPSMWIAYAYLPSTKHFTSAKSIITFIKKIVCWILSELINTAHPEQSFLFKLKQHNCTGTHKQNKPTPTRDSFRLRIVAYTKSRELEVWSKLLVFQTSESCKSVNVALYSEFR